MKSTKYSAPVLQLCALVIAAPVAMRGSSSSPNNGVCVAFSSNNVFISKARFAEPTSSSSLVLPSFANRHVKHSRTTTSSTTTTTTTTTSLQFSNTSSPPPPLPRNNDDPFLLLGIDPNDPTATDPKQIKRAYRKRAMQYHPDVILNADSSESERQKASNDFARINAAYELLNGGDKSGKGKTSAAAAAGAANGAGGGSSSYVPPHRRQGGYASSSYSKSSNPNNNFKSTNWEDYMPNYQEEDAKYDSSGDSFGSILSDLLAGAAGVAGGVAGSARGGSSGIFGDFVDFLERNVDGFESGYDDDNSLSQLLAYGSFDEVANEMDETDVLVTSLEKKFSMVENERMQIQADLDLAVKYSEKMDLEERMAELKAREKVVKGYLKKGRTRLLRLRERYKELMVEGRGGRGYGSATGGTSSSGGGTRFSRGSSSSYSSDGNTRAPSSYGRTASSGTSSSPSSASYSSSASSTSGQSARTSTTTSSPTTASTPSPAPSSPTTPSSSTKSWRNEGFTSSYGGRSSSSRRSSRSRRGDSSMGADESSANNAGANARGGEGYQREQQSSEQWQQTQSPRENNAYSSNNSSRSSSNTNSGASSIRSTSPNNEPWVPPHRRTQSTTERVAQDKRRLRELKVEDDFERLKKEMGM